MEKTIIIVNTGKCTHIIYDGKMYGKDIKEITFHHKAKEEAELALKVNGMEFEGLSEPISQSVRDLINKIINKKVD